jgi:hypothetical protein
MVSLDLDHAVVLPQICDFAKCIKLVMTYEIGDIHEGVPDDTNRRDQSHPCEFMFSTQEDHIHVENNLLNDLK